MRQKAQLVQPPQPWCTLFEYGESRLIGGTYHVDNIGTISKVGALMSEVYEEDTFKTLYASSTPEIEASKKKIQQLM